jgi:endonuclease/exonuclease/phosphatase family metal-dependent hydrolase
VTKFPKYAWLLIRGVLSFWRVKAGKMRLLAICIINLILLAAAATAVYGADLEIPPRYSAPASLRILNLNIHGGTDWFGQYNLEGLITFIRKNNPDVVTLQEVPCQWSSRSVFADFPAELAKALGMEYCFGPALEFGKRRFGNLILSRLPIAESWTGKLPGSLERRSYAMAHIFTGEASVYILTTHLGLSEEDRLAQATALVEVMREVKGPLVLTGDLNAGPTDTGVALLLLGMRDLQDQSSSVGRGTFLAKDGSVWEEHLDYLLVNSGVELADFSILQEFLSDHLPISVDVRLVSAGTPETKEPAASPVLTKGPKDDHGHNNNPRNSIKKR